MAKVVKKNTSGSIANVLLTGSGTTSTINGINIPPYSTGTTVNSGVIPPYVGSGLTINGNSGSYINMASGTTINTINRFDFTTKVFDFERLNTFSKERAEALLSLFIRFTETSDFNIKTLLLNTLEAYNLISEKNSLQRKIKIATVLEDESEE